MGTLRLLPSFAAILLCGLCSAGPAGKEFATVFMQNYLPNYSNPRIQIQISAFHPDTRVKVTVYKTSFQEERVLGAGQGATIQLPTNIELCDSVKSSNTVLITATKEITVVSLNYKYLTADTAVIYPVDEWGTEYYIFTPLVSPMGTFKEMSITNYKERNTVDVYLKGAVEFENRVYPPGSKLTISLEPYESVQLLSIHDLSGSRVVSRLPVAVSSGHTCTWKNTKCNHVYEQLIPVTKWGNNFIVPPLSFQTKYDTVYLSASQPTEIQVQAGLASRSVSLGEGQVFEFQVKNPDPLYITASKGIQVLFLANGGVLPDGTMFDPFLMTILDTDHFCTSYSLEGQAEFKNIAIIVARSDALSGLKFDNSNLPSNVQWRAITKTEFSWTEVAYTGGAGRHTIVHPKSPFAVYSIGTAQMNGYGAPAPCGLEAPVTCQSVTCSANERCEMKDGYPSCVVDKKGICWAWGDPHYHTFDGRNFDFQGTCTYTISKTCGSNKGLPEFEIEAKNENRGSSRVSFVFMVTIKVHGYTITAVRSDVGRVRVNYRLGYLPISLDDGKVLIYQSGQSFILVSDFGLQVQYDWEHYLVVTLSSSYAGKVCGMCGNFNGNPSDDFATPSGSQAPNSLDFGSSWKVPGFANEGFCRDDCNGKCQECENSFIKRFESELFCGFLTRIINGPFSMCHKVIDPKIYFDNCIYDLCMADGHRNFLCRSLQVYAEACQRAGVVVYDWRTVAKCPASCPENSHYELCGNACPATCSDPKAPSKCTSPCIESCQCNSGFVLSAGKCVPESRCGCNYEGRHIPAGEKFWGDDSCKKLCSCNPSTGKAECKDTGCRSGEQCSVVDGVRDCHPVTYSTCSAAGDPHYLTFDGQRFDFMGTCVYQLVGVCSTDPSLIPFDVQVQNDFRGNKVVSYTKLVQVTVYGQTIVMSRENYGKVMVNGELTNLPVYLSDGQVVVYRKGWYGIVHTNFDLTVAFDWNSRVSVTLPSTYAGAVCGLCGNYNSKSQDDLQMKNGQMTNNPNDFGQSWRVAEIPGCVSGCKGTCPDCDITQKNQYQTKEYCGIINDPKGPFRDCHAKVNPTGYFNDCVYDVCLFKGLQSSLCQAITSYTSACQDAGAKVYPWRSDKFCRPSCAKNSHYEVCASGCPATCHSLSAPVGCQNLCTESCVCDDGFILSGEQCVPMSECGCLYKNKYYKIEEVFYPSGLCQEICTCQKDGKVECLKFSCGANEECKVANGVRKCQPVGKATCSASGDPHYTSFDGLRFDFQGTCTYTLAKACGIEGNSHLTAFSVEVENEKWGNGKVAVTKLVAVEIYGNTLILKAGKKALIMLNGVWNNLPVSLDSGTVRAYQHGVNVIIETDFGLRVTYDLVYHATVTVPGNYRDKMCGLCGNYNGNSKDEFRLPNGKETSNIKTFGEAWKVNVPDVVCSHGCDGSTCPVCDKNKQAIFEKPNYCGIINDRKGPLAACYDKISPENYFSNCIYDLCMSEGDTKVLCHSIQSYVTACQTLGVDIKSWRTPSFCPMTCPANSHYEVCPEVCSTTCAGVTDISKCPVQCAEGCACDDGYFFDGKGCVTMDNCGCFENGRYYQPGEVAITDNCKQKCSCLPMGGLVCEEISCPKDTKCEIKNGIRACYNVDPCKVANCRAKETCKVEKGEAVCVPQYIGTCWAWGDPHYHTFDGYNYDFQGTCTYTISKTSGNDTGLVPFSIEEKNDNRGNTAVSYVKLVIISVYGYTVTIEKFQYGKVQVNGEVLNLPVTLDDGKIKLFQSGLSAVLETDFGMRVTYDWNWYLLIQLPSSYYDSVGGLCGNFNGNIKDEMREPDGKEVSSVIDWAKSWRVKDRDLFCWDYCKGNCPTCEDSARKLYESETYCGVLTKAVDGVFRECHVKVDPRDFFDSCVYDVCLNKGAKALLCQATAAYAGTCLKEGIVVKDWRKITGCTMKCQANSHYEACASPCPQTCPFPENSPVCKGTCVESCQCDQGYVLSGDKCVPAASCGCSYQGRYYEPGQKFWADESCHVICECDTSLKMVVCKESSCKSSEQCKVVDGVRGCHPLSYSTCTASGDPHYLTFDGKLYNFMGTCIYEFVKLCSKDTGLTPFSVKVQNDNRGSKAVSFTKVVTVDIFGMTVTISKDYPYKILVNDQFVSLPFYYEEKMSIFRSGWTAVLETDFGLRVTFDWNSVITVTLPSTYQGAVCGLCGNFNKNPSDDMKTPGGNLESNDVKFGDSWRVGLVPGCSSECTGPWCQICSDSQKKVYQAERYCGLITSKSGPFRDCLAKIDPSGFIENCMYDACQYQGYHRAVCDAVAVYASACQNEGITIYPWRSQTFCPATCPRNSHYEVCATGCPATCHSLSSPKKCHLPCKEGCQCDNGFILSGDECVPIAECGCVYGEQYYKKCEVFYPKGKCEEQCKCSEDGAVTCKKFSCGANEECKVANGVQACHPVGEGKCVASGDPHYISFDGLRFNFMGTCTYTLAKLCDQEDKLRPFSVDVENVAFGNGKVAVTKMVKVVVYGYVITINQGMRWKVIVDDEVFHLPLSLNKGRVTINQEGWNVVVQTNFGLRVLYDAVYYVEVIVPGNYRSKMCGLCGNFNGNQKDEFLLPNGRVAENADVFGAGWRVDIPGVACNGGCGKDCPLCDQGKQVVYGNDNYCGMIKSITGPFQACHAKVKPEPYFEDCVFDVCAVDGDKDMLCKSLQAYVIACQAVGVQIKTWRTKEFCPVSCPANSHYELCADTCSTSCSALVTASTCTKSCFEGCQCDSGFVYDGDKCVSMDTCGCVYHGKYMKAGEKIVAKGCTEQYTCNATGAVDSEPLTCPAGEYCGVKNGVRGCQKKVGICTVKPGTLFHSFDGNKGKISSGGAFEIASLCNQGSEEWFRVVVDVRTCTQNSIAGAVTVYVFFGNTHIAVNNEQQTWVNGKKVTLPTKLENEILVHISNKLIIIERKSSVQVTYSITQEVTVTVSADLANKVCGACGNFNGNESDDMTLSTGKISINFQEVINSWKAMDHSSCGL
ncbi:IgGFc-binding protein [Polyodon spathula]|uniref:IgGFc-binding protein n=1 Tax=Polyodon spathula TaxID=7913 RepID=UPI001B7E90B5|nr:IgGFc-binding protein [Polyodon spathula]